MGWKTAFLLSLLWLTAAATPPEDCGSDADGGQTLPMPADPARRPNMPGGPNAADSDSGNGCRGVLPSLPQPTTLRRESEDLLHGLPSPDILRPMDEPKRAPLFQ